MTSNGNHVRNCGHWLFNTYICYEQTKNFSVVCLIYITHANSENCTRKCFVKIHSRQIRQFVRVSEILYSEFLGEKLKTCPICCGRTTTKKLYIEINNFTSHRSRLNLRSDYQVKKINIRSISQSFPVGF